MKKRKILKITLTIFLIMLFIFGVVLSIFYAEIDDAPGFVLFGGIISLFICLLIYKCVVKKL